MHEAFTSLDVVVLVLYILGVTALGTWLGIFLFEHRDRPHRGVVVMHLSS